MYRLLIELIIIAAIFVSLVPDRAFAQELPEWANPIHRCWSTGELSISSTKNASDNENTIISHLTSDQLIALDSQTGKTLWTRDLEGQLLSEIVINGTTAYFAIKLENNSTGKDLNARNTPNYFIEVIAVDIDSGLNNWSIAAKGLVASDNDISILYDSSFLYIIDSSGKLFALRENDRTVMWAADLETSLSGDPALKDRSIYLGTNNKTAIEISALSGQILRQIPLGFVPTRIAVLDGLLFTGNKKGKISSIGISDSKVSWNSTTGGEIVEINAIDEDILVSSNDNYIYRFSGKSGTKMWKRKLSGRLLGNVILKNQIGAFVSVGSNEAVFVDLENGKLLNRISISDSQYFVSPPIYTGKNIIVATDQGLEAYSPNCQP